MTRDDFGTRLYWWSFTVRFAAGLLGWYLTKFMDLPFFQDALFYEEVAASVARDWIAGESSQWLDSAMARGHQPWLVVALLAASYYIIGGTPFTPLAIGVNCLITALVPVLTYRVSLRLGVPSGGARVAGWLVALSPAFAFWSSGLNKEGFILVALMLAVYQILELQERWRPASLVLLVVCLLVIFGLRFYLAIILGAVFLVGLLFGRNRSSESSDVLGRQLVVSACLFFVLIGLASSDRVQQVLPSNLEEGLNKMQSSRGDLALASSGYLGKARVASTGEALQLFPIGLGYFLTVPWPWATNSMREFLAVPETVAWICMYPLVLIGVKAGFRRNPQGTIAILLVSLTICGFYALWITNTGTAFRLRIQVWVLWAVFVGWGWSQYFGQNSKRAA